MKHKALFLLITFFSINACNNTTQTINPSQKPSTANNLISFTNGTQSACQEENLQTKAENDCAKISSKFDNNNLKVTVSQKAFCNSTFKLTSDIADNKLILKAEDTSTEGTRCFCNYNLDYEFKNADKSSYTVEYQGKVLNNDLCNVNSTVQK